jgi:hypothetical protein
MEISCFKTILNFKSKKNTNLKEIVKALKKVEKHLEIRKEVRQGEQFEFLA